MKIKIIQIATCTDEGLDDRLYALDENGRIFVGVVRVRAGMLDRLVLDGKIAGLTEAQLAEIRAPLITKVEWSVCEAPSFEDAPRVTKACGKELFGTEHRCCLPEYHGTRHKSPEGAEWIG